MERAHVPVLLLRASSSLRSSQSSRVHGCTRRRFLSTPTRLPPRPPAPGGPPPIAMPPAAAAAAFLFPAVAVPCRVLPQRRARSLAVRAVASPPASTVKPAPAPSKVRSSSAYSFASNVLFGGSVACPIDLSALLRSLCWAVQQVAE